MGVGSTLISSSAESCSRADGEVFLRMRMALRSHFGSSNRFLSGAPYPDRGSAHGGRFLSASAAGA